MAFRFSNNIFPTEERRQIIAAWLRGIFFEDWVTKSIALIIALGLWYGVTSRRAPITRRIDNVRLVLQLPSETEASNEVQNRVDITLTGDKSRLERLNSDELIVVADLSSYKSDSDLIVQLKPETVNVELPNGVRLDKIEPNNVSVKLEPRIEKLIEVKPVFTGSLPEGYEILEIKAAPARVRVRGAASRVNALDDIPTEKIELLDKTGGFVEKQVTVNLLDPKITVLDSVVDVAVTVGEQRIEKTFLNVKVIAANTARPTVEMAAVTLFGPRSLINSLHAEDLQIQLENDENDQVVAQVVMPPDLRDKLEVRVLKPNSFSLQK